MATITGTISAKTVITVTAASAGDATTIAAMFNGLVFPSVSNVACTATASGSTVTITWPSASMLMEDDLARGFVTAKLAANLTLTSPVTVWAITQSFLA